MRHVLVAAVALAVGLVLGGLQPRADVRRLEARVAEQRECRPLLGSELFRAMGPPPAAPPGPADPAAPEPDRASQADDLAEGRTLLAARRAQARAALIEGADPTPEELAEVDAVVADMNAEIRAIAEDFVDRVRELGGPPPRTELYAIAADGLDVVTRTEARLREALGDRAADVDPDALDPLSHLDPSLVDLAVELDALDVDLEP